MNMLDPKIIRLTKDDGDYFEGVVLENRPAEQRIKLHVNKSNKKSLEGATVNLNIEDWTVEEICHA